MSGNTSGPNILKTDANGDNYVLGTQLDGSGFHQLETVVLTGTAPGPGILLTDANGDNYVLGTQLDGNGNQVLEVTNTGSTLVPGQLPGTTTNDNAAAGNVGEFLTASASNVVVPASATIGNVVTLALTAGDWDVWGIFRLSPQPTFAATGYVNIGLSSSSATLSPGAMTTVQVPNIAPAAGASTISGVTPMLRFSVPSGGTTVFLCMEAFYSAGAALILGIIDARRRR